MRVLFATAELAPLVRVGGLAEAAGGLVRALRDQGVEVEIVLPDYRPTEVELAGERRGSLDVPGWTGGARFRRGVHAAVGPITLVSAEGIARAGTYGDPDTGLPYHDNDRRFFHFSAAVAAIARAGGHDVVHLNDWHTSPVAGMWPSSHRPATVLSVHNLAYQGWCDAGWVQTLWPDAHDPFRSASSCVPLAGALALADRIIAVSPTYAREILTPDHGAGLDGLLRRRAADGAVLGIRNGIDVGEWDPRTDVHLVERYGPDTLERKELNTAALRAELRLDPGTGPLLGVVSRLVDQKGIDTVAALVPFLERIDAQLVVLGAGDPGLAAQLYDAVDDHRGRVAFVRGYDLALAHRITAAADLYLMPSRFEPCGLAQMQAMAYGTLPVVADVGGLHDTVTDLDDDPVAGTGTRLVTNDLAGLVDAVHRAVAAWRDPSRRHAAQRAGMAADWSWSEPARLHRDAYAEAIAAARRRHA